VGVGTLAPASECLQPAPTDGSAVVVVSNVDQVAWAIPARRTGTALVAFGVVGVVLLAACLVAVLVSLVPIVNGARELEQQRAAAVALIAPAADALEATAASAEHAGTSLALSASAARNAASVTSQLADAVAGLAAFSSAFSETADRSRALSDDLGRTADALGQNQIDSATAASQLRVLADRVRQLAERLGSADAPPPNALAEVALPLAVTLVALVLAWLGAIALASVWLGRRLRAARAV
jgi:hypothetical protein